MKLKRILLALVLFFSLFGFAQESQINSIITNRVNSDQVTADGIVLFSQNLLSSIYENANYQQVWSDNKNVEDLLWILNESYNDGLTPDDYHLERIKQIRSDISKVSDPEKAADLDLLYTDGALLLATHLLVGKVDQSKIRKGWDIPQNSTPIESQGMLEKALKENSLRSLYKQIRPDHFMYEHLRNGLAKYREIEENGGWPSIPSGQVLKPDMHDDRVLLMREYLIVTGDLPAINNNDTSKVYDENMVSAIKNFQLRHNLNQDGVVGKGTLEVMNVPIEKRIDEIRINLERARWIIHHLPEDFLVVNIAGYNIRRIRNDSTIFYSRVIVGKHYHESPIFDGTMTYIELNPTWTLPYSIATKETLPKLKKNPDYLSEKNMIIMDRNGEVLDPSTINFNSLSKNNFPYIVRQKAGPHNALGEVKFMFPNSYAVYLHDTPARSLFAREKRAFSHGCIRLDDKWGLFLNLMGDEWNMKKIDEIVASEKTTTVKLKNPIEIMLLYWTAGADKQDEIYFNKDVYDRDPEVLEQLDMPIVFKKAKEL